MSHSLKRDLGALFTLNTTSIQTTYTASSAFGGGLSDNFRLTFVLTTVLSSSITGVTLKVSESYDGVVYEDVKSYTDAGATATVENAFVLGAAGTAQTGHLLVSGEARFYKVSIKSSGGAGKAGESIVVYGQAY